MQIICQSRQYPRAFWLLLAGFFINRASAALIWPFLTLVMRQRLEAPLAIITSLISIQAVAGLVSTSAIGVIMDRFGRKRAMLAGLIGSSAVLLAMSSAKELWQWAVLIALYGALVPIFMIGSNAMVADLVAPEERVNAYALMRMVANLGIAIGPAVGGFLLTISYTLSYHITAVINLLLAGLVLVLIAESLPQGAPEASSENRRSGYGVLLRDRTFIQFCGVFTLVELAAALVFVLLPVYTKENFSIPESQYGWLLTINAGMVVLFQFTITRFTSRCRPLPVLAAGALFYALGLMVIALSGGFAGFAAGIAVLTIGELMVVPTAMALVAALAPADQRARYMSVYALTYTIGSGIGPVIGGLLNDYIAPAAIWYGGALVAAGAVVGFLLMERRSAARAAWGKI